MILSIDTHTKHIYKHSELKIDNLNLMTIGMETLV